MSLPQDLRHALSIRAAETRTKPERIIEIAVRAYLARPSPKRTLDFTRVNELLKTPTNRTRQ